MSKHPMMVETPHDGRPTCGAQNAHTLEKTSQTSLTSRIDPREGLDGEQSEVCEVAPHARVADAHTLFLSEGCKG